MSIVYRSVKGEGLTNAEIDNNFAHLDDVKLDQSVLSENSAMILRDSAGELTHIAIPASRIVGRLASGEVKALTVAEVKGLLAIAIGDVAGLETALDDIDTELESKVEIEEVNEAIDTALGEMQLIEARRETLVAGEIVAVVEGILSTDNVEIHRQTGTFSNVLSFAITTDTLTITSADSEDVGVVFFKVWRNLA
jgi:hypothetical protein